MQNFFLNLSFLPLALSKGTRFLFSAIKPKSSNEDLKRREFIFNVIISGSIIFSLIANIFLISNYLRLGDTYKGLPVYITLSVLILFISLYILSRKGCFILASYILLLIYFLTAAYVTAEWTTDLASGPLLFTMVIVMSGVLISTRLAFLSALTTGAVLIVLNYLNRIDVITPKLYWKSGLPETKDVILLIVILGIIAVISWLSNREIEKSLIRARQSEKALKKERDFLEVRVEERTKELRKSQLEKLSQMSRFAEIGQISTGMFHDLANPLTAISLSLEQIKDKEEVQETKEYMKQALRASEQMGKFLQAVKKQIQLRDIRQNFSPIEEIKQAILILDYKAKNNHVKIEFFPNAETITLFGNAIKFHQMITNLIGNAIDALEEKRRGLKKVVITIERSSKQITIGINDNGKGIQQEDLDKIFDPFFTTKGLNKGSGIGLFTVKQVVENDFEGKIFVKSVAGEGTTFSIKIPIEHGYTTKEKVAKNN